MEVTSTSREVIERMTVVSFPGDPELVKFLTDDSSGWMLDWRDGGLHGDPSKTPRRYGLRRFVKEPAAVPAPEGVTERLEALAAKWERQAAEWGSDRSGTRKMCADELRAAVAARGGR